VSKAFDMLPAEAYLPEGRTPADSQTVRSVFIVGPDKKLKLSMTYPMNVGRNFAEVLRALDGLADGGTGKRGHARRLGAGSGCRRAGRGFDEDAIAKYGEVDTKLPYLRFAKLPG
jgi:hypothetical protein